MISDSRAAMSLFESGAGKFQIVMRRGISGMERFGLWALGFGLWALGFGLWALGFGLWGLGFGIWGFGNLKFEM
jgi:hypothetical protein